MTALAAICALDDEPVGADVFAHYEQRHPERDRGDWELRTWDDGTTVLVDRDWSL